MARVSMNEVKVGLLVLLAILLILTLTASLTNLAQVFQDKIVLKITIESSNGLEEYAQVTYRGVPMGMITRIYYDEELETPVLEATIDANSGVSLDSEVNVTSAGLLSSLYVEISRGSSDKRISTLIAAGELDPGEPIVLDANPYASIGEFFALAGDVKSALTKVEDMLDQLNEPISKVSGLVTSVSRELKGVLMDVKEIMGETKPRVIAFLDDTSGLIASASSEMIPTLQNLRAGSEDVPELMGTIRGQMDSILTQADGMVRSVSPEIVSTIRTFRGNLDELQTRIANIEGGLSQALDSVNGMISDNHQDINKMVDHLKRTSIYLDELSRQLAQDPWRAVWKSDGRKQPSRVSPEWSVDEAP